MESIDQLKARLTVLEKELEKERKIADQKEKEINENPEMKKFIAERRKIETESRDLRDKIDSIHKEVYSEFTKDGERPYFHHKTSDWGQNSNILDDVLFYIDCQSSLHLLKNDDIVDFVKKLISKVTSEKHPELLKMEQEENHLDTVGQNLYHKERELDKQLRAGFESKCYDLGKEISEIKMLIANPKKYIEAEKRQNKRDEARTKLWNPAIVNTVYEKLMKNREWENAKGEN